MLNSGVVPAFDDGTIAEHFRSPKNKDGHRMLPTCVWNWSAASSQQAGRRFSAFLHAYAHLLRPEAFRRIEKSPLQDVVRCVLCPPWSIHWFSDGYGMLWPMTVKWGDLLEKVQIVFAAEGSQQEC